MCNSTYTEKFMYSTQQLKENLRGIFINRMHSKWLIQSWNETFCKGAKRTHPSQSKGPVAGHYMITNSSFAKCVHCVRSEFVTAMFLMIQFYWDVM